MILARSCSCCLSSRAAFRRLCSAHSPSWVPWGAFFPPGPSKLSVFNTLRTVVFVHPFLSVFGKPSRVEQVASARSPGHIPLQVCPDFFSFSLMISGAQLWNCWVYPSVLHSPIAWATWHGQTSPSASWASVALASSWLPTVRVIGSPQSSPVSSPAVHCFDVRLTSRTFPPHSNVNVLTHRQLQSSSTKGLYGSQ